MNDKQFKIVVGLLTEIRDAVKKTGGVATALESGVRKKNTPSAMSWGTYIKNKQPKNDYEVVAMIVDCLARAEKEITVESIIEFIRENSVAFSNVRDPEKVVNNTKNNKHYGYIEFTDKKEKKYYRLSIKGSQLINTLQERELPPANETYDNEKRGE